MAAWHAAAAVLEAWTSATASICMAWAAGASTADTAGAPDSVANDAIATVLRRVLDSESTCMTDAGRIDLESQQLLLQRMRDAAGRAIVAAYARELVGEIWQHLPWQYLQSFGGGGGGAGAGAGGGGDGSGDAQGGTGRPRPALGEGELGKRSHVPAPDDHVRQASICSLSQFKRAVVMLCGHRRSDCASTVLENSNHQKGVTLLRVTQDDVVSQRCA